MKLKTNELIGPALDWAVAKCEGEQIAWIRYLEAFVFYDREEGGEREYSPSTNWAHGGPIIEREGITNGPHHNADGISTGEFQAYIGWNSEMLEPLFMQDGPTPLIAAMRCLVASRLGETIDVPEALCK